ncbi:diphthine methyltransferase [Sitophilus oryzae]|uniref:methylated diphthine methylhydrolase n=1 Tax=Sitophilus oryzae TaxID=7048 RepID=A0A6J2XSE6_SITOR|nr:diphthine methyltransferase [Sitophilus oryzae]
MEENVSNPTSKHIETLYSFNTTYGADSVEWCPHVQYQNFFVCGNYELDETNTESVQKRLGCIYLFSVNCDTGLKLHQQVNTVGILDLKWCPNLVQGSSLLGAVNSDGILEIYQFEKESLNLLTKYVFNPNTIESILILSLDWSTGKYENDQPLISCSDSAGNIHVLHFNTTNLTVESFWHGHTFQAWITAFYYWDTNSILSGGDDALFLVFDKRIKDMPVTKNKEHGAGVTSLHSNKSKEYVIASGSYDENIRLWDIRHMKRSTDIFKMPGTLWRLKWDPFVQNFLLAACMLGGVHIVSALTNHPMGIVESYYEHKNISYGADWSFLDKNEVEKFNSAGNVVIGTCSFYDKLLCISKTYCDF